MLRMPALFAFIHAFSMTLPHERYMKANLGRLRVGYVYKKPPRILFPRRSAIAQAIVQQSSPSLHASVQTVVEVPFSFVHV